MFIQNGSVGSYSKVDVVRKKIDAANTVELLKVLSHFNLKMDSGARKMRCPFSFHKSGRERSSSFYYYPDSNSFYCFGCQSGGGPVDFVSLHEDISKYSAALLLEQGFTFNEQNTTENSGFNEELIICLEFSHLIREFLEHHPDALNEAESLTKIFDSLRNKHKLSNQALVVIVDNLKGKLKL